MPSAVTENRQSSPEADDRVESFRTKQGRCLVDDTYLSVEESYWGYYRTLYEDYWPAGWYGKFVVIGSVIPLCYVAWFAFRLARGDTFGPWTLAIVPLVGAFLLFSAYRRIVQGHTSATRIPLADVRRVRANRGTKGLTRPRLLVEYDADGADRKRYLMLPSLGTPDGEERFDEAIGVLRRAGLTVE